MFVVDRLQDPRKPYSRVTPKSFNDQNGKIDKTKPTVNPKTSAAKPLRSKLVLTLNTQPEPTAKTVKKKKDEEQRGVVRVR